MLTLKLYQFYDSVYQLSIFQKENKRLSHQVCEKNRLLNDFPYILERLSSRLFYFLNHKTKKHILINDFKFKLQFYQRINEFSIC